MKCSTQNEICKLNEFPLMSQRTVLCVGPPPPPHRSGVKRATQKREIPLLSSIHQSEPNPRLCVCVFFLLCSHRYIICHFVSLSNAQKHRATEKKKIVSPTQKTCVGTMKIESNFSINRTVRGGYFFFFKKKKKLLLSSVKRNRDAMWPSGQWISSNERQTNQLLSAYDVLHGESPFETTVPFIEVSQVSYSKSTTFTAPFSERSLNNFSSFSSISHSKVPCPYKEVSDSNKCPTRSMRPIGACVLFGSFLCWMFRFVSSILRIPVKNLHRKRLMDDFLEIQRNRLFFWCPSSGILEKKIFPRFWFWHEILIFVKKDGAD